MTIENPDPADNEQGSTSVTGDTNADALIASLNEGGDDDSDPADDLLLAGYQAVTGDGPKPKFDRSADKASDATDDEGDGQQVNGQPRGTEASDDDRIVLPGFTAKQLAARLAQLDKIDSLEKGSASLAGHVGHMKQLLAQKGQPITGDMLENIRTEFGEEYADALAKDLTKAGLGGFDASKVSDVVDTRLAENDKKLEFRLVRMQHRDAPDYFAGGKHNAEFVKWVGSLPADRQEVINSTWEAETIVDFLGEFKEHRKSAQVQAQRQQNRVNRAITPTRGASSASTQAAQDPLEAGWNNVRGKSPVRRSMGG